MDRAPSEEARVDAWLWSVRIFPTRSAATDATKGGHVRVNGTPAKPAARVRPGDEVRVRAHSRERVLEVCRAIEKRVGAPVAAECYIDRSPPPPPSDRSQVFARDPAAGRPTKRDRRQLDRLRRRGGG